MSSTEGTILLAVCRDFLLPGETEPLQLIEPGLAAIDAAIELTSALGELDAGLEEALLLAYSVEGQGDSPTAARAIRRAIAANPTAMKSLGIGGDLEERALRDKGRRIARRKLKKARRSVDRPSFTEVVRIDPR